MIEKKRVGILGSLWPSYFVFNFIELKYFQAKSIRKTKYYSDKRYSAQEYVLLIL